MHQNYHINGPDGDGIYTAKWNACLVFVVMNNNVDVTNVVIQLPWSQQIALASLFSILLVRIRGSDGQPATTHVYRSCILKTW
jgi:hypothetical protein